MAFSASLRCPAAICPSQIGFHSSPAKITSSSVRFGSLIGIRASRVRGFGPIRSSSTAVMPTGALAPAIALTDKALSHLSKMRSEKNEDLCLRIGVKQGGCSGMSYTMEFENRANTRPDDSVIEYNGFVIVCDPKSLLFLYGMQLDYSDALIGGGFAFKNPNATQTCGCGKSFAAEMWHQQKTVLCNLKRFPYGGLKDDV
ncbi:Iron-sulfur assembly protein IscA, chloroplastic-like protein [Drosera capensis]